MFIESLPENINLWLPTLRPQPVRMINGEQSSLTDHSDPVAQLLGLGEVVCVHKNRDTLPFSQRF